MSLRRRAGRRARRRPRSWPRSTRWTRPLRRGESARLDVVVRTRKVGHFFPGGTVDAFDVWVELEVVDSNGKEIFHSGSLDDGGKGPVEPGAHFYRSLQLDEHGNPINKRNAWATRSVAYVRLIPPGAADTVHYRLRMPEDCGDRLTVKAKLNYRKFAWWNTQWAFAGVRDPGAPGLLARPRATTTAAGSSPATPSNGVRQGQGDPRHPDHGDGRGRGRDPRAAEGRAGAEDGRRSSTRRSASAGTTTASGCCCRAT